MAALVQCIPRLRMGPVPSAALLEPGVEKSEGRR